MSVLAAAVVLLGLLCLVNLLFTVGVVRRLRSYEHRLANSAGAPPVLGVGERIGEFATTTVDGEPLSHELLDTETVVAFFSPDCAPCRTKLPTFVDYARTLPAGRAVATVVGSAADAAGFVEQLSPVARVVVEEPDAAMGTAFHVRAFPTLLRVARGDRGLVVTANDVRLGQPAPVG
jgi:thiol-disulfide isomerase/thioredoxin